MASGRNKEKKECHTGKVHNENLADSDKEKYLGDFVTSNGKLDATIEDRVKRANSYISEISSILKDVPLGKARVEMGLQLRRAMFINGVLFNSEAWHNIKDKHLEKLQVCDNNLLRSILKAHPKTPVEFLHLETGTWMVKHILQSRRLNYLHSILTREDGELVKRVLAEQTKNPNQGDWIHQVKNDLSLIEEIYDEQTLASRSKMQHKILVKTKMEKLVLHDLQQGQINKSKICNIKYLKLEMQEYLSKLSNKQCELLVRMRSKTTPHSCNTPTQYMHQLEKMFCPHGCSENGIKSKDTLEHQFSCEKMENIVMEHGTKYDDIFSTVLRQELACATYVAMMKKRDELLNNTRLTNL